MSWRSPAHLPRGVTPPPFAAHELTPRLGAVAAHVPAGVTVADVGTDHGHLPRALLASGHTPSVLAMDVARGPLSFAKRHLEGFGDRVSLRLGSGLSQLHAGEAHTVTICGMGGETMEEILTADPPAPLGVERLIVQPQSRLALVRHTLVAQGYTLTDERFVVDGRHFYLVMVADRGGSPLSFEDAVLGPVARVRRGPCFEAWLSIKARWWRARMAGMGDSATEAQRQEAALIERTIDLGRSTP
ncbi:MAG: tRNA (adenine(22)-N(1))-methyltransferase [Bradymonadia bacterium]